MNFPKKWTEQKSAELISQYGVIDYCDLAAEYGMHACTMHNLVARLLKRYPQLQLPKPRVRKGKDYISFEVAFVRAHYNATLTPLQVAQMLGIERPLINALVSSLRKRQIPVAYAKRKAQIGDRREYTTGGCLVVRERTAHGWKMISSAVLERTPRVRKEKPAKVQRPTAEKKPKQARLLPAKVLARQQQEKARVRQLAARAQEKRQREERQAREEKNRLPTRAPYSGPLVTVWINSKTRVQCRPDKVDAVRRQFGVASQPCQNTNRFSTKHHVQKTFPRQATICQQQQIARGDGAGRRQVSPLRQACAKG